MNQASFRLGEIAAALGAELDGDPNVAITGIATLQNARAGQLAFLANASYARYLADTAASAVILAPDMADRCPTNVLVLDNPYLGYARLSHWFATEPAASAGVHPSAVVDPSVTVPPSVAIGPNAVIEANVVLGESVVIGAGCLIGARCRIGAGSRLHAGATLAHDIVMGERCNILSGAVIGGDGFGFANDGKAWHRIAQLGGVVLGDDVEVGANTTIDRGALDDTVIGNGVKLDNLIQIGHNVSLGDHTAIAASTAIGGSTKVGQSCIFGGASAISGHVSIGDRVHLTGMTMVTGNLRDPGVYSSGISADTNRQWRKNAVRFRQLDAMARKLRELEKSIEGRGQS